MKETNCVTFPQPKVDSLLQQTDYWFIDCENDVVASVWTHSCADKNRRAIGNVYLTEAEAEQRAVWNAQQMARLVIPTWFRALGPDVECKVGKDWLTFTRRNAKNWIENWSQEKPESYRAKPKPAPDVIVNVNGVEYRWPATVGTSDPQIDKYLVCIVGSYASITRERDAPHTGNRTHYTHAGAEAQAAMFNATLGVP